MSADIKASEIAQRYIDKDERVTQVERLGGGISNINYHITTQHHDQETKAGYVLTVYPEISDWWKIEKERVLRDLTQNDKDVLFPRLVDCGTDTQNGNKFAFILREFVHGIDLDSALQINMVGNIDWKSFCHNLGFRLASIHSSVTGQVGVISMPEQEAHSNWLDYMNSQISSEYHDLWDSGVNRVMAGVSTEDILHTESGLVKHLDESSIHISTNHLAHGDTRFANLIATNQNGLVEVKSFIDLEWALSGDPEIDVAFIENWLVFSSYADEFNQNRESFLKGYLTKRKPSETYQAKRKTYHAYRSLNYLKNVFLHQNEDFVKQDPRYPGYIQKHMGILGVISKGQSLEEFGIQSLI
ncbi:hypothetical protein A2130_01340 [Candidatus Woesebacteria bacterium GWC2_33_12]|uniref:Aminoglycoside phosphotransferase domain-containing protein n=1 Tax=Candidatus Woesebacteria bacterium GW2011_GWB1_33_22 TaxID=1618566 RepID=A0A0G0CLG3_9BACT|nr:MAG: hypothetical protein UR29_C0012G0013 [Candidatus Woesebacteria bacterium GW2011_GWC2_33_12]KKP41768.1 MAG: hypothetical protein UR33_C0010G0013 [Candidatus Woesebacteria bacterium GW2011_GWA2_33_20]KKP44222.1 MAG: hypothetical protein UR35_C0010G0014 [Candidatus Woesebacteria bacterium GW2011_GWB1_33_22]KKP45928.1 MAG: hypothetical protein UR37_C0013G0014 [Microgenomates group bacterium GW2011_GWC1_33_28]KKP49813.1 MAG: hypothetical protein UR41_C0012G0014 [Candidatus Woesebacteria bact